MIITKFGGSSVDSAPAIERVAGIVRARLARRPVVVVSAMGKTTRRLLEIGEAAARGDLGRALELVDELRDFHVLESVPVVAAEDRPALDRALAARFGELRRTISEIVAARALPPRLADEVAAYGELLASEILTLALRRGGLDAEWLDCRRLIVTDDRFTRANPLYPATEERLRAAVPPLVAAGRVPVLGGYVGATPEGVTTTLGREGSDFTAAIVGAALGAEEVQIWTDVDGMLTTDPRVVPAARRIRTLSFAEALELASAGAKVLHPGTLGPAEAGGLPVRILNSRRPPETDDGAGTLIGRRAPAPPHVKSIAFRHNAYLLRATSDDGAAVRDAARRLAPAVLWLGEEGGEALLALDRADRLAEVLDPLLQVARVEVLAGRPVVSLVSEDLVGGSALAAQVLATAAGAGTRDARLVADGATCPTIRVVAAEEDVAALVAEIHQRVFDGPAGDAVP
ncbi:MAG TPA: aspartate kinase [Thermoanaerobaculia bacterium]|nr:aspartate kinase [Thermoanaerobaculia bacterium]